MGELLTYLLLFVPGAVCCVIGFRIGLQKPGQDDKFDDWHDTFGRYFRWTGSVLVLYGFAKLLVF